MLHVLRISLYFVVLAIQEECDSDPVSACLLDMVIDLCYFVSCDDTSICNVFSHNVTSVSRVP